MLTTEVADYDRITHELIP